MRPGTANSANLKPQSRPVSRLVLDADDGPFDEVFEGKVQQTLAAAAKAIIASDVQRLKDLVGFNRSKTFLSKDYLGPIPLPANLAGMGLTAPSSSLLHLAVRVGNTDAALTLTSLGYPVGAVDSRGDTPILIALTFCPDAVEKMLKEGKGRNLRYIHRKTGRGVLHEIIASPGVHANGGASSSRTASQLKRMPLIEYLVVEYGVNPKERDASGLTPLEHAQNNYLQLGMEADQIIAFLEDPPKAKSQTNLAQGRKAWEFGKHPLCRFLLPIVLSVTHVIMYLIDTVSRGTGFPPAFTDRSNTSMANSSSSSSASGSGSMVDTINVTTFAPPDLYSVLVEYPRRNLHLYHTFVAHGRRADVASLPFFNDIFHQVALEWPSSTSVFAAKLMSIVLGFVIGILVFTTLVHVLLRDVLKFRFFGAHVPVPPDEQNDFTDLQDGSDPTWKETSNPLAAQPQPPGSPGGDNRYKSFDGADAPASTAVPVPSCWDLVLSTSPLVASSRGRGRLVLAFFGAFVGVYCGGLVYNAMLDHGAFTLSDSDIARLRMKSDIFFTDGTPVRLCDMWYIRFSICAFIAPLIYATVLDEMFQMLSAQLFLPSTWYSRFGNSSIQTWWGRLRLPITFFGVAIAWGALLFLFIQDGIAFSFDDLPRTLLPSPHLAINLCVGGMAVFLDVLLMLQSWALPDLQSLVIVAKPFERKASSADPMASTARLPGGSGGAAANATVDADEERQAKRAKLLAGVHHVVDVSAKQNRKLKGKERELARRNANASQRSAGPDEFVVVEVRNAFKVPFTFMRGNLHWLLWLLVAVDLVLDIGFVAFYINEIVTTKNTYPSEADPAKQFNMIDRYHGWGHSDQSQLDVLYFALALLPSFFASVLFLLTLLRNTVWATECCGREHTVCQTPAIHELTEETLVTALPWPNEKVAVGGVFNRKSVASINRVESALHDGGGSTLLPDGSQRNTAYDAATGPNVIVDVWACAYRDDVVRLGALLDAEPNLLNERGGIGIRIRARTSNDSDHPGKEMASPPGFVLNGDPNAAPEPEEWEVSPPRPTLVAGPQDRVAELLPDGTDDPAYYGATPLHYAILGGARSAVMALLSRGANTRLRSMNGLCGAEELAHIARHESIANLLAPSGGGLDRDPRDPSFHSMSRRS